MFGSRAYARIVSRPYKVLELVSKLVVNSSIEGLIVYTGLQEIAIQECKARSEMEAYISLTRPVCMLNIEII